MRDGVRHSWGVWGAPDRLGTLNNVTPEAIRRGIACVRKGETFSLNLPHDFFDPPLFEREVSQHTVLTSPNGSLTDVISDWNTQGSTQWDGFRHIAWEPYGSYNGVPNDEHGVHHWAARPIVTRAILLDLAESSGTARSLPPDKPALIEVRDLESALHATGLTAERGDVLLIRTGWLAWYRRQDAGTRRRVGSRSGIASVGLAPREEMAEFLWDLRIAAVAADNPALEAWPQGMHLPAERRAEVRTDPRRRHEAALHVRLLPALGMPIGELWDLDAVAADCRRDHRYEMCLTSAPLNIVGGVATPANAIAVK